MDFKVRGKPQIVQRTSGECYTLHDPFNATALDLIRRCLDQVARGLHLVIVHTYENASGFNKEEFFVGKDHKAVNPRNDHSGLDIMYLLKNIKHNVPLYYEKMEEEIEDEETLHEVVDFLLDIRNRLAHECYLHNSGSHSTSTYTLRKFETTKECLAKGIQLLDWISCVEFYTPIGAEVSGIRTNLKNITNVLEQLRRARQSADDRENNAYNSRKAEEFLSWLIAQVREEDSEDESFECRPITHLVNMVVAPRVNRRK